MQRVLLARVHALVDACTWVAGHAAGSQDRHNNAIKARQRPPVLSTPRPRPRPSPCSVNVLIPQPYSQRHNSYLSAYVSTGRMRLVDRQTSVVAMHRLRHVFPVHLLVMKLQVRGLNMQGIRWDCKSRWCVRCWSSGCRCEFD